MKAITPQQSIQRLRGILVNFSTELAATHLGVSKTTVKRWRDTLGVPKHRNYRERTILKMLQDHPEGLTTKQIADAITPSMAYTDVWITLRRLQEKTVVASDGRQAGRRWMLRERGTV